MARILVADDSVPIALLVAEYLRSRGHQVAVVHDGVAATVQGQDLQPDLIIMDIQMPGAYGTTAYKSLESAGVTAKVPILFMTSVNLEQARKVVPVTPLTRLLAKPIDLPALETAVAEMLPDKR
ncbi:MAG: response regulator [Elusimicrobia bacterium]|nr:response regulator [Elusimicrobiota bacterium]